VVRLPVERSALLADVQAFRAAIADRAALPDVEARARTLYDTLVAKALPAVHGDRLLIVPHDVLHYLPFAALRDAGGHWLVERYTLTTLPSASVLKYLGDKGAAAGASTLAIGNPDIGPGLELRFAEREARLVAADRGPGATVLVRGEATEARAKSLLGSAGVVHFATHGDLDENDPLASALLLAPGGGEDGRLEVREVLGLDMHARLVVLSACETGLGKLSRGDELVGLQRAFLYAGTPAVVTTLWKVDDRASYELVRVFYERLAAADSAPALRQAQLEVMKTYAHPFAWAAFVLTGVPR
jgi:CHAT domain-containing protein